MVKGKYVRSKDFFLFNRHVLNVKVQVQLFLTLVNPAEDQAEYKNLKA
jgi:hypothetical protein